MTQVDPGKYLDLTGLTIKVDAINVDGTEFDPADLSDVAGFVADLTATAVELNALDAASSANDTTGLAAILGTSGALALGGAVTAPSFASSADLSAGVGITGGTNTVFKSSVIKEGGIFKTTILIDLTGLNGGGTAGDVIGTNGSGAAYLGQITAAANGTILGGKVTCLETPAGSNVDVDVWSADENTGVEDTAISALTNEVQLINHGNWAAGEVAVITGVPVANQYLYLTSGAATSATFTAGQFLIELYGY